MKKPQSVASLENLGRVRLSKSFFMRDFLYSEIANFYGIPNIPDDSDLAIANGKHLCEELLEPLQSTFGRIAIRSAYRSPSVNQLGNEKGHNCASNESGGQWPTGSTITCRTAACVSSHRYVHSTSTGTSDQRGRFTATSCC
jgi:hypothetical protein